MFDQYAVNFTIDYYEICDATCHIDVTCPIICAPSQKGTSGIMGYHLQLQLMAVEWSIFWHL